MPRIEIRYSIEDGLLIGLYTPFKEVDKSLLQPFRDELESKPVVKARIVSRFESEPSEDEILKEYLTCFYGGNDTKLDIDCETSTPDYCHCGGRGMCPDEGFPGLCSIATVGEAKLSKTEVEALQLVARDKSVKEIASIRNRSRHTIEAEARSIREKLKVCSIAAAAALATSLGIVRT
jgi:DNA-binding CsgD family transcriptional regulator